MLKSPAGFVIMTYIFVMNPLTHSATLLGENFRKETFCKTTLDFILINGTSQRVPYHLKVVMVRQRCVTCKIL